MSSTVVTATTETRPHLETAALVTLCLFVGALQFSIAASAVLLSLVLLLWAGMLVSKHEQVEMPSFCWPLVAYAGYTMVSVAASLDPLASLVDSREVLLFLVVPLVYRLASGRWAPIVATIVISVGAVNSAIGIWQYGILEFDTLGQRPQGSMGHYMTYSGLLMLVICLAAARVLFAGAERMWAALVLPALIAALAVTLTRNAWVGASVGVGLLLVLKDRRLLAVAPVLAALVIAMAPTGITDRVFSTFDLNDPTNRDRFAMGRAGVRMIRDHPLTGVGPDMVQVVYADYRDAGAVNETNPHLHNVPLQIAAERGLPALALWLWFIAATTRALLREMKREGSRALAAGGLAAMAAMLAAGMFEYNFGDSEFLMLFLVIVTLPAAAARRTDERPGRQHL